MLLLITLCACLLHGMPQTNAPKTGVLEGELQIVSSAPVEPQGGPVPTVTPETYAEFPLIVLAQDDEKVVAEVTADKHGRFHLELLPGRYVLDVKDRRWKHIRGKAQPFTIRPGETTHVIFHMDTGVRASARVELRVPSTLGVSYSTGDCCCEPSNAERSLAD